MIYLGLIQFWLFRVTYQQDDSGDRKQSRQDQRLFCGWWEEIWDENSVNESTEDAVGWGRFRIWVLTLVLLLDMAIADDAMGINATIAIEQYGFLFLVTVPVVDDV